MDLMDLIKLVLIVVGAVIGMALNITGNVVYHVVRIGLLFKDENKGKKKRPPKK